MYKKLSESKKYICTDDIMKLIDDTVQIEMYARAKIRKAIDELVESVIENEE